MYAISIISILGIIIALECAVTVYKINRRSPANIIFILYAVDFALMCIFSNQFVIAHDYKIAVWLLKAVLFFGILQSPILFHFAFLIARKKIGKLRLIIILSYTVAALLWIMAAFSGYYNVDINMTSLGWRPVINSETVWPFIFEFYFFLSYIISAVIIYQWGRKTTSIFEKKQARTLFILYITQMIALPLTPSFYLPEHSSLCLLFNSIAFFLVFFFIIGVRYSIMRHRLMAITPESPVTEIIEGMHEPVFFISPEGTEIVNNQKARDLMKCTASDESYPLFDRFNCHETAFVEISKMINNKDYSGTAKGSLLLDIQYRLFFNLTLQAIRDANGELSGIMVIAREDLSLAKFKKKFNITNRQMDIIFLSVSGLTNRDIAVRLNLSERTVENHLFNIYNRIGIDNKIELINSVMKYNILSN